MSWGEHQAFEWYKGILARGDNNEYLYTLMLAALYVNTKRSGGNRSAWFGGAGDPGADYDYTVTAPDKMDTVNIIERYRVNREGIMEEAYKTVTARGMLGDLAKYLLFRNAGIVANLAGWEKAVLEARALDDVIGACEDRRDGLHNEGIGYAAGAAAAAAIAAGLSSNWVTAAASIPFWVLAAALGYTAWTKFDAEASMQAVINTLGEERAGKQKALEETWGNPEQGKYSTWLSAWEYLLEVKAELNRMLYGRDDDPGPGYVMGYDNFRVAAGELFAERVGKISHGEVMGLYTAAFFAETDAGKAGDSLKVMGAMNDRLESIQGMALAAVENRGAALEGVQKQDAVRYRDAVGEGLEIPAADREALKALAERAGDLRLSVAEREAAAAAYESYIDRLAPDTEGIRDALRSLAGKAWGDNTWDSKHHDLSLIGIEAALYGSRTNLNRASENYTINSSGMMEGFIADALEQAGEIALGEKEYEWAAARAEHEAQHAAWQAQMKQIWGIAQEEWVKAKGKLNEGYYAFRKRFADEYEAKSTAWEVNYLNYAREKQGWVEEQYRIAAEMSAAGMLLQAGDPDEAIGKAAVAVEIETMSREELEVGGYIETLLGETKLAELTAYAGNINDRGRIAALVKHDSVRTSGAAEISAAQETMRALNDDLRKGAAKLAALRADTLLAEAKKQYEERLEDENEGMETWEKRMVLGAGYRVEEGIRRDAVVDATALGAVYETQSVHQYEKYVTGDIQTSVNLEGLEGLDEGVILQLIQQVSWEIKRWGEKVFGKIENGEMVEHYVKKGSGEQNGAGYAGLDMRGKDEALEAVLKKLKNDETLDKDEEELYREYAAVRDGELGAHIGYGPEFSGNPDLGKGKHENVKHEGAGELGKILLDFQWNEMKMGAGFAELAKPAYDKKLWEPDLIPWMEPPTARQIVDTGVQIYGTAMTAVLSVVIPVVGSVIGSAVSAGMGFASDMIFLTASAAGGYVEGQDIIEEGGLSFTDHFMDFTLGAMTAGIVCGGGNRGGGEHNGKDRNGGRYKLYRNGGQGSLVRTERLCGRGHDCGGSECGSNGRGRRSVQYRICG
jgi:hypothetical protein